MKVKLLWMILLLALPCGALGRRLKPEVEHAMAYGAEAKICLKVHDDAGASVPDASVAAVLWTNTIRYIQS